MYDENVDGTRVVNNTGKKYCNIQYQYQAKKVLYRQYQYQ